MSNQLTVAQEFGKTIDSLKPQLMAALPAHVTPEKFIRTVMTAIQTNASLLSADRTSLLAACMKAAQDGLLPDGKESALVPFKTNGNQIVQYMPMIGGILKKVRNSGELASITAQVVFKNDSFEFVIDSNGEHFSHKPLLFGDRGEAIGAYAMAKTKDAAIYFEFMNKDEVASVMNVSRAKGTGPWAGEFKHEMWKKTVIRRLSKRLPMSSDLDHTIHSDDDFYKGEPETAPAVVPDETVPPPAEAKKKNNKPSRLKTLIPQDSPAIEATATQVSGGPGTDTGVESLDAGGGHVPINEQAGPQPEFVSDEDIPI